MPAYLLFFVCLAVSDGGQGEELSQQGRAEDPFHPPTPTPVRQASPVAEDGCCGEAPAQDPQILRGAFKCDT